MKKLTSLQMAEFAATGLLRFDAVVPDAVNRHFMQAMSEMPDESPRDHSQRLMRERAVPEVAPGTPLAQAYEADSAIGNVLQVPEIAGAIASLVGQESVVDHHFLHITFPGGRAQDTHQDSTIDTRRAFDIQMFYFPHAVTPDMGGTRFVPGTHLRLVSEMSIGRYQNVLGQQSVVCPAGSVFFFHHGIWHGAGANRGHDKRYVLKIRLCPTAPQQRLWDTSDMPESLKEQQPIFWKNPEAPRDPIHQQLMAPQPWFEHDTGRLEMLNRVRFWRYLSGDESFDMDYWATRIENDPARLG